MVQSATRTLETVIGELVKIFPLLERPTIMHSDELITEKRTNQKLITDPELGSIWFYTADSNLYVVENREAILYIGREPTNPIFNNIEKAAYQLLLNGIYLPSRSEIMAVKSAESTLRFRLSDLELEQLEGTEFSYFEVQTDNYDKLNPEQRRFAERVYGQGDNFKQNMEMLWRNGIGILHIYVLNPDFVKKIVPNGGAVALASKLGSFEYSSLFCAGSRDVDYLLDGLRGVRNITERPTYRNRR